MSPEPAPGVRGLGWDNAVPASSKSVHPRTRGTVQPSGQPISHSTNAGLSWGEVWAGGEDSAPGASVIWARGKERQATSFSGREFLACVSSDA